LECRNTGYHGRQGIYEILVMNDTLQEAVHERTELDQLRRLAMKDGMHTLRLSGAQKVAAGMTTVEEVLRVAPASRA
ncbi:MAG TPA: type II/IV secretion system protein, partial [Spongiibacteraceae bacterium]|nr:type II/IV secretion system protein [Spongiibacteraceae bacterium]